MTLALPDPDAHVHRLGRGSRCFAKNIVAGHGGWLMLIASALFHWLIFLLPWLWLAMAGLCRSPRMAMVPIVAGRAGDRRACLSAFVTHQPVLDALLMPISTLLMTLVAAGDLAGI